MPSVAHTAQRAFFLYILYPYYTSCYALVPYLPKNLQSHKKACLIFLTDPELLNSLIISADNAYCLQSSVPAPRADTWPTPT